MCTACCARRWADGRKAFARAEHEGLVRELCKVQPDITLDELHARLAAARVRVGRTSAHQFLKALGLTRNRESDRR
jgi:hypothetical protein